MKTDFLQRQQENTNLHVHLISTEHHGKRFWLKCWSPVFENCLWGFHFIYIPLCMPNECSILFKSIMINMLIHFLFSLEVIEHLIAVIWANTMWISNTGVHTLFYLNNTVWILLIWNEARPGTRQIRNLPSVALGTVPGWLQWDVSPFTI